MEDAVPKRRHHESDAPDERSGVVDLIAQVVRLLVAVVDALSR
jgi:hypothetical protein